MLDFILERFNEAMDREMEAEPTTSRGTRLTRKTYITQVDMGYVPVQQGEIKKVIVPRVALNPKRRITLE
jgi:hypothetical protein